MADGWLNIVCMDEWTDKRTDGLIDRQTYTPEDGQI